MHGWSLMENNITDGDFNNLIQWLQTKPRLTNGDRVKQFEREWSQWLGVKFSVFVNSGASSNLISMMVLKHKLKQSEDRRKEVLVCPMNWISDITSIIHAGFTPKFVDMDPSTLSIDNKKAIKAINENTVAIMLTHLCGFNALSKELYEYSSNKDVHIIEDVCESHGVLTFDNQKCGTKGIMSCFSFYYGHHVTTIEGGMVCTNDENVYQMARMFRSHGLVRECTNQDMASEFDIQGLDYKSGFVFAYPGFNLRNTEIGGVMGSYQLKSLDNNIQQRRKNFDLFLAKLDPNKYRVDFNIKGNSNFAFILVLKESHKEKIHDVCQMLSSNNFEYRRGAIGGNQLRQPYLNGFGNPTDYPETEFMHFYSVYIGNFHNLDSSRIKQLCTELNKI